MGASIGGCVMSGIRVSKGWLSAAAVFLVFAVAVAVGIVGCGGAGSTTTTWAGAMSTATTVASASTTVPSNGKSSSFGASTPTQEVSAPSASGSSTGSSDVIVALEQSLGQKVISDAQLEIEVASGKFQTAFDQALLLADRYNGYIVSSSSQASGEDSSLKSGTIALRVPSASFALALSDASKLGTVRNRQVSTQDVTQEYVDLQAQITNAQAQVKAFQDLMARAKTVDDILQVQQVLSNAQGQLDQLKGRAQFLTEHTNYSTLTMSIYETGVEVKPVAITQWGVTKALKDGLHNLVNAGNAIVRGLGVVIPILIVLAIIGYIVYRIIRASTRRGREREQRIVDSYQQRQQSQFQQAPAAASTPAAAPDVGAATGPSTGADTVVPEDRA